MREGDDLRTGADEAFRRCHVERAVVVHRDGAEARAGAGGELLPGDEVRVVLGLGDHDLVALAEAPRVPEGTGHEVEPRGRARGPHELLGRAADELRDGGTGIFEQFRRFGGERVRAPVHRGVRGLEEVTLGIQDRAGLLARRAGVEVDEGPTVDLGTEDREVGAHGGHVEGEGHGSRLRGGGGGGWVGAGAWAAALASAGARGGASRETARCCRNRRRLQWRCRADAVSRCRGPVPPPRHREEPARARTGNVSGAEAALCPA